MEHNIITEPSVFAEVDETTVGIEGIATHEPFSTGVVKFTFAQEQTWVDGEEGDDVDEADEDMHGEDFEALVDFEMTTEQAIEFATNILQVAQETQVNQLRATNQTIAYRAAQSDCVRGRVGTLIIERSDETSPRYDAGAILVNLKYLDDVEGDGEVIHDITNLETHIRPFDQMAQFDWLRSLVGGNHDFTSKIAIKYENFSFEEIEAEWRDRLGIDEEGAVIVHTPDAE